MATPGKLNEPAWRQNNMAEEQFRLLLEEIKKVREDVKKDRDQAKQDKEQILNEVKAVAVKVDQLSELQIKVDQLTNENADLKLELERIKLQVDMQDQQQKSKNLILYGVPGQEKEDRNATEAVIRRIFTQLEIHRAPTLAHRLSQKSSSPILVQFTVKQDAQEVFQLIRRTQNVTLE